MATLRVLSYNVRSLRDDPEAVARVVKACRPDVLCLQEAPRLLGWRRKRRLLASRCGLRLAVNRRPGGLAILVRPEISVLLSHHHRLRRYRGLHLRALSLVVLNHQGHEALVAVTHLDLDPRARLQHAEELLALLARHQAPVVLAADVNELPGGPTWRLLTRAFTDTAELAPAGELFTFTARRPRTRIDAVLADPRFGVVGAGVPEEPSRADLVAATDHRPLLAELLLSY
ncbi:endonuclease/exonuclease/phosphatase family protein [Nocardiopsis ansamitocini]|uniref:endonuclease/exonuclease/phosphatase family protein n=1 Tax=Nocardiopsis ansamitocini TaxID=1670832 RepID=UPI002556AB63|nr:endonuclease/exonuclease/phosphatase family protein [Nocardiopsis ansamitocini]